MLDWEKLNWTVLYVTRAAPSHSRIDVSFAWLPVPGISGEKTGNEGDYENLSFSLLFDFCLNVILTILIL